MGVLGAQEGKKVVLEYRSADMIGKTYKSNNYGEFKVLVKLEGRSFKIEFVATGYKKIVSGTDMRLGSVKDDSLAKIKLNSTYCSKNYGKFLVKSRVCSGKYLVEFIDSGAEKVVGTSSILSKEVKDPTRVSLHGVLYLCGDSLPKGRPYNLWTAIITRCTVRDDRYSAYSKIGVTLDDKWKDYGNFLAWYNRNYIEGFEVDKDLLSNYMYPNSPPIYGEDTCCFLPKEINIAINSNTNIPFKGIGYRNGRYRSRYGRGKEKCFSTKGAAESYYLEEKSAKYLGWLDKYPQLPLKVQRALLGLLG